MISLRSSSLILAILASLSHIELSISTDKDILFTKRTGFGQSEDYEIFTSVSTGMIVRQLTCEIRKADLILISRRDSPEVLGHQTLQLWLEIRWH